MGSLSITQKKIQLQSMALWKMPLSGGEESQVLPSVLWRAFSLVNDGIYFIPEPGADGKYSIQFLNFATGKVKTVVPIPGPSYLRFQRFAGRTIHPVHAGRRTQQRPHASRELPVREEHKPSNPCLNDWK